MKKMELIRNFLLLFLLTGSSFLYAGGGGGGGENVETKGFIQNGSAKPCAGEALALTLVTDLPNPVVELWEIYDIDTKTNGWLGVNGVPAKTMSVSIQFHGTANAMLRVTYTSNGKKYYSTVGTINYQNKQTQPGSISPDQSVVSTSRPAELTGTPASGSAADSPMIYQWEKSIDQYDWQKIDGATGQNYSPPMIDVNTYYRRVAKNNSGFCQVTSNVITIEPLKGSISGEEGEFCLRTNGNPLTVATEGSKTPTIQWQKSRNDGSWVDIAGASSAQYTPIEVVDGTYKYRAKLSWESGTQILFTNEKRTTYYPAFTPGNIVPIHQNVVQGLLPEQLVGTTPSGGNGVYTYEWQILNSSATWEKLVDQTAINYQPPKNKAASYRRFVTSGGGCADQSNVAVIELEPLNAGSIGHNATIGLHGRHHPLVSVAQSNGKEFKWEIQSNTGGTLSGWTVVQDWSTESNYSPSSPLEGGDGAIYQYRRWARVVPEDAVVSNVVEILLSAVDPGSIMLLNPRSTLTRYDTIGWIVESPDGFSSQGTQKRFRWQVQLTDGSWRNLTEWGDSIAGYKNFQDVIPLVDIGEHKYRRQFVQDVTNEGNESFHRNSNEISVMVENLNGGTISSYDSIVMLNAVPGKLINIAPGNGNYYKWQYREVIDGTWSDLTEWTSGISEYNPTSPMTQPFRQYRRLSKTLLLNSDDQVASSNISTVIVQITEPGFISISKSVIVKGGKVDLINVETGTGTVFKWQVSRRNENGSWGNFVSLGLDVFSSDKLGYYDEHIKQESKYRRLAKSSIGENDMWTSYSNEVTVTLEPLRGGVIARNQTILKNGIPAKFTNVESSNGEAYQWQRKHEGNAEFSPITEFSTRGSSYQETEPVNIVTYYRRIAKPLISSDNSDVISSNELKVDPAIELMVGNIAISSSGATDTIVDSGTFLSTFSSISDGNATIFKWQKKSGEEWINLTNWGNHTIYTETAPIFSTSLYRRCAKAHTTNTDDLIAYSNELTITINNLTGGTISGDTTINLGDLPGKFANVTTGDGSLYKWQKNTKGVWIDLTEWSASNLDYIESSPLLTTTYYRRLNKVENAENNQISSSNVVTVMVQGLDTRDETITASDLYLTVEEATFALTDELLIKRSMAAAQDNITLLPIPIKTPIIHNIIGMEGEYRATFSTEKGQSKTVKVYVTENFESISGILLFAHDVRIYTTEITDGITDSMLIKRASARGYDLNTQLPVAIAVKDREELDIALSTTPITLGIYPILFGYLDALISKNVIITEQDSVTVTFDVNFDDINNENFLEVQRFATGEPYNELPIPNRNNSEFLYWSLDTDGLIPIPVIGTTIVGSLQGTENDHTLYAIWKYTVMLELNGGSGKQEILVQQYRPYQYFQQLPIPQQRGYYFVGWSSDPNGETMIDGTTIVEDKNEHTLYAIWEAREITVLFDPSGGTVPIQKKTVRFNEPYQELPIPQNGYYKFLGWYMADGKKIVETDIVDTVAVEITLYAKYQSYSQSGNDRYVITPNGDDLNDRFYLQFLWFGKENKVKEITLYIYSRQGNLVYTQKNYQDQDGAFDGSNLPDGTYIVVIHYVENGEKKIYNATITIIR